MITHFTRCLPLPMARIHGKRIRNSLECQFKYGVHLLKESNVDCETRQQGNESVFTL